jgi:DNA-directed RNA polymerase subunit RPC12/RpoP
MKIATVKCSECGRTVGEEYIYCPYCGTNLKKKKGTIIDATERLAKEHKLKQLSDMSGTVFVFSFLCLVFGIIFLSDHWNNPIQGSHGEFNLYLAVWCLIGSPLLFALGMNLRKKRKRISDNLMESDKNK